MEPEVRSAERYHAPSPVKERGCFSLDAPRLNTVATEIRSGGGVADTAVVDALDEAAVDRSVEAVIERAGQIDISFSVISLGDIQMPLTEISVDDFTRPIMTAMRTQFSDDQGGRPPYGQTGLRSHPGLCGDGPQILPGDGS
jgi:NAD(P)-dependent dehydrogenase (short-subunit alcohol dehydrogenase family)